MTNTIEKFVREKAEGESRFHNYYNDRQLIESGYTKGFNDCMKVMMKFIEWIDKHYFKQDTESPMWSEYSGNESHTTSELFELFLNTIEK